MDESFLWTMMSKKRFHSHRPCQVFQESMVLTFGFWLTLVLPLVYLTADTTGFLWSSRAATSTRLHGSSQDEDKRSMIHPKTVMFHPFQIQLNQMSVSYPHSWVNKLFSAVPKRPFALEKLDFLFQDPQVCIITGDSNAGKSTLLRVISKREQPTDGSCTWTTGNTENQSESYPVPIYLAASTDTPKYESYSSNLISRSNGPISHDPTDAPTFQDHLRSIVAQKTHKLFNQRLFDELFLVLANVFFTQSELESSVEGLSVSLSQSQIYRTR